MLVRRQNPFTGKWNEMELPITFQQYYAYQSGMKVQNAFPHLTPDQREFILTGITPDEWDNMFNPKVKSTKNPQTGVETPIEPTTYIPWKGRFERYYFEYFKRYGRNSPMNTKQMEELFETIFIVDDYEFICSKMTPEAMNKQG